MFLGGTEPQFWRRFRAGSFVFTLATVWALGPQAAGAEDFPAVPITLKGGQLKEITLDLGPDQRPDLIFDASLDSSTDKTPWPKDLQVDLVQNRALVQEVKVPYSPGG